MGEMLHRRTWIFFLLNSLWFSESIYIFQKEIWRFAGKDTFGRSEYQITRGDKPEHHFLWQNPPGNKPMASRIWKYQSNIAGFDPSVSSQGLSDSCLLILGPYHTAPALLLTVHSHTNTFMLLPNSLSAPKLRTGSHSPAVLRNYQKNNHYLRNWQLFPFPELYFRLSPSCKETWQWDPKATRQLECPHSFRNWFFFF